MERSTLPACMQGAVTTNKPSDGISCIICGSGEQEENLVLCDGCDVATHIGCMHPKLSAVPEGVASCSNEHLKRFV